MTLGDAQSSFRVVFICTGNRFRSPIAESALRAAAADLPVEVTSVGTLNLGPVAALEEAVSEAAKIGLDVSAHQARWLGDAQIIGDADLILGFERRHALAALESGAPPERTFLLLELVMLLEGGEPLPASDPVEHARQAVAQAHHRRLRDRTFVPPPGLKDPLGRPDEYKRYVAERVHSLARSLVTQLFRRGP
jgi:protein-tyrosine phosphatase